MEEDVWLYVAFTYVVLKPAVFRRVKLVFVAHLVPDTTEIPPSYGTLNHKASLFYAFFFFT